MLMLASALTTRLFTLLITFVRDVLTDALADTLAVEDPPPVAVALTDAEAEPDAALADALAVAEAK